MLSKQEEEQERREVLENDRRVREQQQQTGTFFSHGVSQALDTAGGRYGAAMGAPNVTGATPIPKYPAAAAHQADPVGTEPPLGFSVNDLEPSAGLSAAEATGGAAAPSAPPDVEPAPPPSSQEDADQ
jgi:hypothetical protein